MPVTIKDYTWRQTDELVIVRVPLRCIPHTKVDLFTSDIYIKVHFPPYLFECCLYDRINEDASKCTLVRGDAVFELAKYEKNEWPSLNKELSKQEMIEVKKLAIEHAHEKATEMSKKRKEGRMKRQRDCVGEQVAIDGERYTGIQQKKEAAKGEAVTEILEWKEKETDKDFLPNPIQKACNTLKALKEKNANKTKESNGKQNIEIEEDIFTEDEVQRDMKTRPKTTIPKKIPVEDDDVPPLRSCSRIGVDFTYRAFPTPSRESKLSEEQEWLKKQAEARRKTGFVVEDLRPEENDPQWLLEKGSSFHDVGNYLGAISAFTHALQTWIKIPELWIARANSQLCVGNYRRVLRDTTEALELLKPHVSCNADMRFAAHLNRGRALLEIGEPRAALADLEEALVLKPYREDVHNLIDRAESDIDKAAKEVSQDPKDKQTTSYIEPEDLAN